MLQPHLMKLAKMRGLIGQNGRHRRGKGPPIRGMALQPFPGPGVFITGITRDCQGNPLGNCTVKLFGTDNDVLYGQTTSDGSGNYSISAGPGRQYYVVVYKAGSPDVAGTSVNTLQPV